MSLTDSQQLMVSENVKLVYWYLFQTVQGKRFKRKFAVSADAIQWAYLGLCDCIRNYDKSKGSISTFSRYYMRHWLQYGLRHEGIINSTSIDAAIGIPGHRAVEFFEDRYPKHDYIDLESDVSDKEEKQQVINSLNCLNPQERAVVVRLLEGYQYLAIGKELGLSKERIRQIRRRAILKIKVHLRVLPGRDEREQKLMARNIRDIQLCEMYKNGAGVCQLARHFGLSRMGVSKIIKRMQCKM